MRIQCAQRRQRCLSKFIWTKGENALGPYTPGVSLLVLEDTASFNSMFLSPSAEVPGRYRFPKHSTIDSPLNMCPHFPSMFGNTGWILQWTLCRPIYLKFRSSNCYSKVQEFKLFYYSKVQEFRLSVLNLESLTNLYSLVFVETLRHFEGINTYSS